MLVSSIIKECIEEAHHRYKNIDTGKNADYIPYLKNIDSSLFGISVSLTSGEVISVGDCNYSFGIESISKVATAILAMNQHTPETVMTKIGADATGLPFNSIAAMVGESNRPSSPLVNAGAMSCCSLIEPTGNFEEKWNGIMKIHELLCGDSLTIIEELYQSESETNYNNRAIAWILKKNGTIYDDPKMSLDLYTKQCSIAVNADQLAVFGGTIANRGTNPVTGNVVFKKEITPNIISLMAIQGFYEMSGHWLYSAGIPGKSGVGGGIVGVMPNKFGIAAFSPKLDGAGNSVRAQKAIKFVVKKLGFNVFGEF